MDIEKLDLELIAALQGIESQANRKAKRRALSASEIEA
jgi:hypothetical protein